jgi:hypothetical protein
MLLHGKIRLARVSSLDYDFDGDFSRKPPFSLESFFDANRGRYREIAAPQSKSKSGRGDYF